MDLPPSGPALLVAAVLVVLVVGLAWHRRGRLIGRRGFVPPPGVPAGSTAQLLRSDLPLLLAPGEPVPPGLEDVPLEHVPGRATDPAVSARVVVVGTRSCSDCARTVAVLRRATADEPTVRVHHVLAERAPGLVERLQVRTAPTVLLVDAASRVVGVHPGPMDADVARAALEHLAGRAVPSAGSRRTTDTGGTR